MSLPLFPLWNPHYPQPNKPTTPASSAPPSEPLTVTLVDGLILSAAPDELLKLSPSLQQKIRSMHEKQKHRR